VKIAYVDTSCFVAMAFAEPGADKLTKRLSQFSRLISSNLLEAELRSALAREAVEADCAPLLSWIAWLYPDRPLSQEFREVLVHGHARGADLWHLACAQFLRKRLGKLSFLTLDRQQRDLAKSLGFSV
jgi:predicted nucleic acid-binding protein